MDIMSYSTHTFKHPQINTLHLFRESLINRLTTYRNNPPCIPVTFHENPLHTLLSEWLKRIRGIGLQVLRYSVIRWTTEFLSRGFRLASFAIRSENAWYSATSGSQTSGAQAMIIERPVGLISIKCRSALSIFCFVLAWSVSIHSNSSMSMIIDEWPLTSSAVLMPWTQPCVGARDARGNMYYLAP